MQHAKASIIEAKQKLEGGGFKVREPLPNKSFRNFDPFLLLHHIGPVDYKPGEAVGAPDHPHRGFETVTYILSGGWEHLDSKGNSGHLGPGWVQWMTAGSGVIHSEMPDKATQEKGGRVEGFQLWVNLPKVDKMIRPHYQDIPASQIPVVHPGEQSTIKVIADARKLFPQVTAAAITRTDILMLDVTLPAKSAETVQVPIPRDFNAFFYVYRGSLSYQDQCLGIGNAGFLAAVEKQDGEERVLVLGKSDDDTDEETGVLVVAGKPISEPVVQWGPFVMNTQEEIDQAYTDYQLGVFGEIDGAEERRRLTQQARRRQSNQ